MSMMKKIALAALSVAALAFAKPKGTESYAFSITSQEFENTASGNILRGTLYMPERKNPAHYHGARIRRKLTPHMVGVLCRILGKTRPCRLHI